MVLWKSCWLSSATRGPEQGHVTLIDLVATEPHLLHLMSCSWYRTLLNGVGRVESAARITECGQTADGPKRGRQDHGPSQDPASERKVGGS